ncbi:MAG: hypothetical protein GY797_36475 [Deltaproteobacteria bacterium]|nr:hypothetical protein [Deltaproteobacteria bacterium]
MKRIEQKQERLKKQIMEHLDMIMGSITTKGPHITGYNLTCTVDRKTRTRYIRKGMLKKIKQRMHKYQELKKLLIKLSDVNFEILRQQEEQ